MNFATNIDTGSRRVGDSHQPNGDFWLRFVLSLVEIHPHSPAVKNENRWVVGGPDESERNFNVSQHIPWRGLRRNVKWRRRSY
jgi:hypothetical protein